MSAHDLIGELTKDASRFDFFEAVRLIECMNRDKPRFGTSVKAVDDAVRFSQEPELEFPATAVDYYSPAGIGSAKPRLAVNFMGLFGPNGPLPLHLTEYARERQRHHHDPTFSRFADVFHHRMISLFYRAWANARPEVHYDRPDSDRFGFYVGAMLGLSGAPFQNRDALTDRGKLFYAGHFAAQTKHPEGLQAIVSDIFKVPVRVAEFVGEWMDIQPREQTRLGWSTDTCSLGSSVVIGASVWGCQHKFRVVIGPLRRSLYLALLPGGALLPKLVAIVRNYAGDEMVWDAQLILEKTEVPEELALGKPETTGANSMNGDAQLGWSTWLGPRRGAGDADDLTLNPFIQADAAC